MLFEFVSFAFFLHRNPANLAANQNSVIFENAWVVSPLAAPQAAALRARSRTVPGGDLLGFCCVPVFRVSVSVTVGEVMISGLKKNLNASKSSEHPLLSGGEIVKTSLYSFSTLSLLNVLLPNL